MKKIIFFAVFAMGTVIYGQTFVTSNKDGTPDNHYIPDTANTVQTYSVSSKKMTSLRVGKNAEPICIPVQTIIDNAFEPVKVSSQKFKKD